MKGFFSLFLHSAHDLRRNEIKHTNAHTQNRYKKEEEKTKNRESKKREIVPLLRFGEIKEKKKKKRNIAHGERNFKISIFFDVYAPHG